MAKRKPLSKGLRFEVFKRDHFTCQYCGSQPPIVVLVIDHIEPLANGGSNDISNLITACEPCNCGKRDKSLATRQIRPDADLLYLETQQEIAELNRYSEAKREREAAISQVVEDLQNHWCECSGLDWCPKDHLVRQYLTHLSPSKVEEAFSIVAPRVAERKISGDWAAYVWGVIHKIAAEENNG